MSDRAKALKVIAIISSSYVLFSLIITLIISFIDEFTIYPYIFLLISVIACISLWKMYLDEKNVIINKVIRHFKLLRLKRMSIETSFIAITNYILFKKQSLFYLNYIVIKY